MILTSKLITCFIDGFTSGIKSQAIAYFLIRSAHIYWISNLEGEVHPTWNLQSSNLQLCKGNVFLEVGWAGNNIWSGSKIYLRSCPCLALAPPKAHAGVFNVHLQVFLIFTMILLSYIYLGFSIKRLTSSLFLTSFTQIFLIISSLWPIILSDSRAIIASFRPQFEYTWFTYFAEARVSVTLFNHVGWLHDPRLYQLYFVAL